MPRKRKNKFSAYVVIIIIIILVALFIYKRAMRPNYDDPNTPRAFKGLEDAQIVVSEFSDFQCSACRSSQSTVSDLLRKYGDKIRLDFRHLPLISIHPFAFAAAEAFECANDQGKAWELHNLIFESQPNIAIDDIKRMADDLDINREMFDACLGSRAKTKIANDDMKEGRRLNISSTPTFLVNGRRVSNWQLLLSEVESELRRAGLITDMPSPSDTSNGIGHDSNNGAGKEEN